VLDRNIGLIECYLDSMVKAALLGKIKDAACIDIGIGVLAKLTNVNGTGVPMGYRSVCCFEDILLIKA